MRRQSGSGDGALRRVRKAASRCACRRSPHNATTGRPRWRGIPDFCARPFGRIEPAFAQLVQLFGGGGNGGFLCGRRARKRESFKAGCRRVTRAIFKAMCPVQRPNSVNSRLHQTQMNNLRLSQKYKCRHPAKRLDQATKKLNASRAGQLQDNETTARQHLAYLNRGVYESTKLLRAARFVVLISLWLHFF